jgi:hypothetical protein
LPNHKLRAVGGLVGLWGHGHRLGVR